MGTFFPGKRRMDIQNSLFLDEALKERILSAWETFSEEEKDKFEALVQEEKHYVFQSLKNHPNKETFLPDLKQLIHSEHRKILHEKESHSQEQEENILNYLESEMEDEWKQNENGKVSQSEEKLSHVPQISVSSEIQNLSEQKHSSPYQKGVFMIFLLFVILCIGGYFFLQYILNH